ncbi:hypothetical protein LEGA110927_03300 [Leuconostoc gasicomitatum]|uniref:hypothetical protein n=1 Tax=Leuconostoc gasicomitatum TaxID=115778 RepID=UPI000BCDD251|nr:hypothetical protein [Leuconostoc gasicomitatum]MBZ5967245.1 hypothetical protein [Leuconostoc gasicomitatum]QFS15380.1 hypothetical protein BHS03_06940 [Leuconostoc gasicomitatum]SOB97717.1 conserved hypothetical protein [Leuconostoc gasicomitatum]DAI52660.1 MAG TPA: hypothetical protein [Caudoviricetes sp.]
MNVPDAVDFYKPDAAYQNVSWKATLISEVDYTEEEEDFDTEKEAQLAVDDCLQLLDLKISQLMKKRESLSVQLIRKVVD